MVTVEALRPYSKRLNEQQFTTTEVCECVCVCVGSYVYKHGGMCECVWVYMHVYLCICRSQRTNLDIIPQVSPILAFETEPLIALKSKGRLLAREDLRDSLPLREDLRDSLPLGL